MLVKNFDCCFLRQILTTVMLKIEKYGLRVLIWAEVQPLIDVLLPKSRPWGRISWLWFIKVIKVSVLFLFRGIIQLSKLHLFVGNFKNNRIEILPDQYVKGKIQSGIFGLFWTAMASRLSAIASTNISRHPSQKNPKKYRKRECGG